MQAFIDHEHARELDQISQTLDNLRGVLELLEIDLTRGRSEKEGRPGMSAEQVLRAAVVKQMNGFSYEELGFHLMDSTCYRTFCRFGAFEKVPSRSALQENIKRVSAESWEAVDRALLKHAVREGIEDGRVMRGDCTSVETNIHVPTDSWLLWDTVRTLTRLLKSGGEYGVEFTNHRRRAKRRWRAIGNARRREERVVLYRDLLKVTEETLREAETAISQLEGSEELEVVSLAGKLKHCLALGKRVVDQTRRRVLGGETVPSQEKVVSIFEEHSDILVKGSREVEYGHKVCLTGGKSGLVLDCLILTGNPADQTLAPTMLERHGEIFGTVANEVVFDGGFASKSNLSQLKAMGVQEVAFSKRCGLPLEAMVTTSWVYKRLRNFRAGIEGYISYFKRCFGLTRCLWRGFASFKAYVRCSLLSANLLTLARHKMAG
jgi:IS5 family transposase